MPLNTPADVDEVIDRSINDVFLALQEFGAQPSLSNSWLNSLIVAYANRVFDFYFALDQAALEALPDTAIDNLPRWGTIYKVTRNAGSVATGNVVATGSNGSVVELDSVIVSGDGFEYTVLEQKTVSAISQLIVITSDGLGTATAKPLVGVHGLSNNVKVSITGANQAEYNLPDVTITVISETEFTYAIEGTPATPATGLPTGKWATVSVPVESVDFDTNANVDALAGLQFESPSVGIDETVGVDLDGLTGALDREEQEAFRSRVLDRIQNPVAHFNVADIEFTAKKVTGVTRVFVFEITPSIGQVTVYFMRDEDETSAIPSGAEVVTLKTALDLIRPANTAPADLIVLAPTAVPVDFSFSSITPNTSSLKDAVEANLAAFFKEQTEVGVSVSADAYRSIIFNTVDTTNGDTVTSFVLVAPTGDILVSTGEIATLGTITI